MSTPTPFSLLPIEIKSQIIKLAKLQDDSFKERLKSDKVNIKRVAAVSTRANPDWKGKSLLSLHLVDKEFSSLAAAEIFYQLKISKANQVFQRSILPNHFSHIQSLELDAKSDLDDVEYALSISPLLPSLKKMKVSIGCAGFLGGDAAICSILHSVRVKIQTLKIKDSSLSDIAQFIKLFPNLEELDIYQTSSRIILQTVDLVSLGNAILESKELRRLSLNVVDIKRLHQEWSTLDWTKSSLPNLTILSKTKSAPAVQLATLFSHSLETLSIKSATDSSVASEFSSRHVFPLLRRFTLSTRYAVLSPLLSSFSLPSIQHLYLKLNDFIIHYQSQIVPIIKNFITSHLTLRTLRVVGLFIASVQCEFYSNSYLNPNNNLQIDFQERVTDVADTNEDSSFRSRSLSAPIQAKMSDALVKSFSELLDFGKVLFEDVAKEGDNEALFKMGEKLDWIKAEMMERKD